MSSPYRKPDEPPTPEAESGAEDEPSPLSLGFRVSSHDRTGVIAAVARVRGVVLHRNGLAVWGVLGPPTELLFSEIDSVRFFFATDETETPRTLLGTFAGETVEIPAALERVERVIDAVDQEVSEPLVVPAREALASGAPLVFGPLRLGLDGIELEGRSLPWSLLPRVVVTRRELHLHAPDTHGRFAALPLVDLPHPRVLLQVLAMRTRVLRQGSRIPGDR